jgi:chlorobactene glucosyltransferase
VVAGTALADRRALRRLPLTPSFDENDVVSMIVPARNEASNITAWLADARRQRVRDLQIIVVDDDSQDETFALALRAAQEDQRVEVLHGSPPPAGWIGKSWAAQIGARQARGSWLLFSDADMRMRPEALPSALQAARALGADALSATSTLVCGTFWERQIMPAIALLIFSAIPVFAIHDERLPTALLAGGFMLVRAPAYWLVGGHAAVAASIAEDRDLAERLKSFGYRIRMLDGSELMRVRMYRGLSEMWEGWRKNFYEGVRRNCLGAGIAVLGCLAMLVLPMPTLAVLWVQRTRGPLSRRKCMLAAASAVSVAATVLVRLIRDPAVGIKTTATSVLLTPAAGAFTATVMAASAWRILSGRGQVWKGRTIR